MGEKKQKKTATTLVPVQCVSTLHELSRALADLPGNEGQRGVI